MISGLVPSFSEIGTRLGDYRRRAFRSSRMANDSDLWPLGLLDAGSPDSFGYFGHFSEHRLFGRKNEEAISAEPWWGWYRWVPERYRTPLSITFAFVATHNHFVLDHGGKVFNRTAPVIKLSAGAARKTTSVCSDCSIPRPRASGLNRYATIRAVRLTIKGRAKTEPLEGFLPTHWNPCGTIPSHFRTATSILPAHLERAAQRLAAHLPSRIVASMRLLRAPRWTRPGKPLRADDDRAAGGTRLALLPPLRPARDATRTARTAATAARRACLRDRYGPPMAAGMLANGLVRTTPLYAPSPTCRALARRLPPRRRTAHRPDRDRYEHRSDRTARIQTPLVHRTLGGDGAGRSAHLAAGPDGSRRLSGPRAMRACSPPTSSPTGCGETPISSRSPPFMPAGRTSTWKPWWRSWSPRNPCPSSPPCATPKPAFASGRNGKPPGTSSGAKTRSMPRWPRGATRSAPRPSGGRRSNGRLSIHAAPAKSPSPTRSACRRARPGRGAADRPAGRRGAAPAQA